MFSAPNLGKPDDPNKTQEGTSPVVGLGELVSRTASKTSSDATKIPDVPPPALNAIPGFGSKTGGITAGVQGLMDKTKDLTGKIGLPIIGDKKVKATGYTQLKEILTNLINNDDKVVGKAFKFLEEKSGISRKYLAIGLIAILVLYLAVGYGAQLLSNVLGFVYPSYASIRAIESPDSKDDTVWLTYWVVFGFINIIELPFDFILQYIPFFYLFKCLFFVWCFSPVKSGSAVIYNNILKPYFNEINEDIKQEVKELMKKVVTMFQDALLELLAPKIAQLRPGGK